MEGKQRKVLKKTRYTLIYRQFEMSERDWRVIIPVVDYPTPEASDQILNLDSPDISDGESERDMPDGVEREQYLRELDAAEADFWYHEEGRRLAEVAAVTAWLTEHASPVILCYSEASEPASESDGETQPVSKRVARRLSFTPPRWEEVDDVDWGEPDSDVVVGAEAEELANASSDSEPGWEYVPHGWDQ